MTSKPPIVNFVPFHPSRVSALRSWRERDLLAHEQKIASKSKKKTLSIDGTTIRLKPERKKKSSSSPLPAGLKADAQTQAMLLEILGRKP